jgi:hypothetical protein
MASPDALKALIEALETEQKRRQAARFGGQDPRTWLIETLQQMAQRFAATAHLGPPLDLADMAPVEMLAAHLLPEHLRPAGLPTEDQIWAQFRARARGNNQ